MGSEAAVVPADSVLVRRFLRAHPEIYPAVLVVLAWLLLLAQSTPDASQGLGAMPGMDMSIGHVPWWGAAGDGLGGWELMVVAMMGPATLAGLRHVYANSLRWRRKRAMGEFAVAYLAVWAAFGFVVLGALSFVLDSTRRAALPFVLAAAALWEVTPWKRRVLRACHRARPLPPSGLRAELGALRFGLRQGSTCVGSCWVLMLVMATIPFAQLACTAVFTAVVTCERLAPRPRLSTRVVSGAFAVGAIGLGLAVGL